MLRMSFTNALGILALALVLLLPLVAACTSEEETDRAEDRITAPGDVKVDPTPEETDAPPDRGAESRSIFSRSSTATPEPTDEARDRRSERRSIFSAASDPTPEGTTGTPEQRSRREDRNAAPPIVKVDPMPDPTGEAGGSEELSVVVIPRGSKPPADRESDGRPVVYVTATPGQQVTVAGPICQRRQPDPEVMRPPASPSAETDKEALLALFEATGGETWDQSGTWGGFSPIGEWQGVGVDGGTPVGQPAPAPTPTPRPTHAEFAEVADKMLAGELPWPEQAPRDIDRETLIMALQVGQVRMPMPDDVAGGEGRVTGLVLSGLTGELPPELGNLTALQTLSITGSGLGGELPPELGNLTALQTLSITGSGLGGELPPELGNLTALQTLIITDSETCGRTAPGSRQPPRSADAEPWEKSTLRRDTA